MNTHGNNCLVDFVGGLYDTVKTKIKGMKSLNGKVVRIIGNTTNHQFKVGQKVKIINDGGNGTYGYPYNLTAQGMNGDSRQFSIAPADFSYEFTEKEIQEDIDRIQKEKDALDVEIKYWTDAKAYMKETGVNNFDEMEFKSYKVLQTINESTSDIEKAKIIAKILQG